MSNADEVVLVMTISQQVSRSISINRSVNLVAQCSSAIQLICHILRQITLFLEI